MNPSSLHNFHDIFDFYYVPVWRQSWFFVLVASLLSLIVVAVLLKIFFYYRSKRLTPWRWAIRKLDDFDPSSFETKEEYKKFYYNLTALMKEYFSLRFLWRSMDKTDVEFIEMAKANKLDSELVTTLDGIFSGAAWVKFANQTVLKTQAERDLKMAKEVINQTIPKEK